MGFDAIASAAYIKMISGRVHDALEKRLHEKRTLGLLPYGYDKSRVFDESRLDEDGRPMVTAKNLGILPQQAEVVREIYRRYADGESPTSIAADFNARRIASPGSRWTSRRSRRTDGKWLASTLLSDRKHGGGILCNAVYHGVLIWNRSQWKKHPDSGARVRFERPQSEWMTEPRPDLRIVDKDLWRRVQARITSGADRRGRAIAAGIAKAKKRRFAGETCPLLAERGHRKVWALPRQPDCRQSPRHGLPELHLWWARSVQERPPRQARGAGGTGVRRPTGNTAV